MPKYNRTLSELKSNAVLHWPEKILCAAGNASVLPLLLKTQDAFISLLKVANKSPLAWSEAIKQSNAITGPVFLKHLMVMTDLGGEALNKLPPLSNYCPSGVLLFDWGGKKYEYKFKEIQNKCSLANSALRVDSKKLLEGGDFTPRMLDVAMLLMFGSTASNDSLPMEVKDRCIIGTLIGHSDELDKFAKENYIRVSRQVGGATSNALGQLAQDYVVSCLKEMLPPNWIVSKDSSMPNVSHSANGNGTNFDVVAISPKGKYFGIEVSFQVTTNSVIERKARESESLMSSVHAAGHKICYVIDGAGNINIRQNAVGIICSHSDCTVAMSESEMKHMANYLLQTNS
ncbi:hypothetical protein [Candidatus Nitrotoga fabula]|uniref:Type-2 restriction enzyme BanI n=1 Tax=Candidatus Nitrotoga fabula TaxID=2182327 RepID=A0A916BE92_9PROT|nr:hypothetical protein [Candidatus Nitrotoga fabula]CAE6727606.1 Type-2 restriction enzyme BanI [Candidatus Nitrotoga fabula]